MTGSPALIEPADLKGSWALAVDQGAPCPMRFGTAVIGNGHALEGFDPACLARLGFPGVAFWRASSDGIGLANGEGRTVAFFSRQPDGSFRLRNATIRRARNSGTGG